MATRKGFQAKRGVNQTSLKWDKSAERRKEIPKGIKPLPDAMSLQQMVVVLVIYCCRKVLLTHAVEWKICVYGIGIVFGSILCDFFPLPKAYMSDKHNILNVYFAKFSWGWTLLLVGAFVYMTSTIYCCGIKPRIAKHMSRLLAGTVLWYICISMFVYVETVTGFCIAGKEIKELKRHDCLKMGYRWRGFDISGHTFLLMYCSLVIYEEAKAMNGWERIKDMIRDMDFDDESPLRILNTNEIEHLKTYYEKFGHYVKGLFIAITLLNLLWGFILIGTVLYYHSMAQKLAGGLIAILAWFITYRILYVQDWSLGLPGQGPFKYAEAKPVIFPNVVENRRRSIIGLRPPLRANHTGQTTENDSEKQHVT